MTTVVSPLSALVIITSRFVLRLWSARLSCVVRLGVGMIVLQWLNSYLMLSKQQARNLWDLLGSLYFLLCLSLSTSILARVMLLMLGASVLFVQGGVGMNDRPFLSSDVSAVDNV